MKGDGVQIGLAVNAQVRALQASAARLSTFVVMGQPLQSLATQLTHAYDAQRGIDGLVVDLESVGHTFEYAAGRRRPAGPPAGCRFFDFTVCCPGTFNAPRGLCGSVVGHVGGLWRSGGCRLFEGHQDGVKFVQHRSF